MKITALLLLTISSFFGACKSKNLQPNGHKPLQVSTSKQTQRDSLNSDEKSNKSHEISFGRSIHSIFKNKGKYYIAKCYSCFNYDFYNNNIYESSIIEITLNKVIQSCPDHHGRTTYTIDSLGEKAVGVKYVSHYSMMDDYHVMQGRFIYKVSDKIDTITLLVDGLPINEQSAKKLIQKKKIYILSQSPWTVNGPMDSGIVKETECTKKVSEKYGFKPYYIGICIPSPYFEYQIKAYNNVVFNYLRTQKYPESENYNAESDSHDALSKYSTATYKCRLSEQMDKDNIGDGKSQKEIWEEIIRKYKKLPETARSTDSIGFWFDYIRIISDAVDNVDVEAPLEIAEKESDYLTKHGLIMSCFVLVNWKNKVDLEEQVVNRIVNVANDVQKEFPIKNKILNSDPWYSHYDGFKKTFKKE